MRHTQMLATLLLPFFFVKAYRVKQGFLRSDNGLVRLEHRYYHYIPLTNSQY